MAKDKQSTHFDDPLPLSDDEMEPIPAGGQEDQPIPIASSHGEPTPVPSTHAQPMPAAAPVAGAPQGQSAVRAIKSTLDAGKRTKFKRTPVNTGTGAVRCRLFHCKVAESSMEYMQDQINTWLDDEQIDVKHVGHMVGMLEGKHTEPNVIVMIWY